MRTSRFLFGARLLEEASVLAFPASYGTTTLAMFEGALVSPEASTLSTM
jgi:hypothetical protein